MFCQLGTSNTWIQIYITGMAGKYLGFGLVSSRAETEQEWKLLWFVQLSLVSKEGFQTVQCVKLECSRLKSAIPAHSLWHLPLAHWALLWGCLMDRFCGWIWPLSYWTALGWQVSFIFPEGEQGHSTYTKQDLNSVIESKNKLQRGKKGF